MIGRLFSAFGGAKPPVLPAIAAESLSECGLVRPANEDHFHVSSATRVYCVADGMGGGAEGAKASEIVCRELRMMMNVVDGDFASRVRAAQRSLVDANAAIHDYARQRGFEQMGSTAAILIFDPADGTHAAVIHVGDSRVYRVRGGLATPLTRDHSIGFELSDFAGSQAAAFRSRANPLSHVLTRAIGVLPTVTCETKEIDVRPGDRFVLCSDGVHDVVTDARLAVFVGGGTLATAKQRLRDEVLAKGAPDNFTFILLEVEK